MPAPSPIVQTLAARLKLHPELDPQAVFAVARQEGLGGGIGDGGTSFGPFQLHKGGALPSSVPLGNAQAWATSPAGIDYALNAISKVAGGLRGKAAIENIVRRFERPADPNKEVAGAVSAYGASPSTGAQMPPFRPAPVASGQLSGPSGSPFVQSLFDTTNDILGLPTLQLPAPRALASLPAAQPAAQTRVAPSTGAAGSSTPSGALAELLHEGVGGPTHSTGEHIHAAFTAPQDALAAISLAQKMGLAVRENPYTDPVDPVHSKTSFHYRTFPGLYGGRKLGEAIDVSGPNMTAFYTALAKKYGRT